RADGRRTGRTSRDSGRTSRASCGPSLVGRGRLSASGFRRPSPARPFSHHRVGLRKPASGRACPGRRDASKALDTGRPGRDRRAARDRPSLHPWIEETPMSAASSADATALRSMMVGYEAAQVVYVAAKLGIADLVGDETRTSRELAERTGAHEEALQRVLMALASLGILRDLGDRRFGLTERGRYLRSATPGSLRRAALLSGERWDRPWGGLLHSVETGETAFEHVFGMRTFEYMAQNPALAGIYNDAMSASAEERAAAVVGTYDFSRFRSVADVGGGHGALLAAILVAHPAVRGIILERASVVTGVGERL